MPNPHTFTGDPFVVQVGYNLHNSIVIFHNSVQFSGFVISRVWQKNKYSLQTYILLCQKTIYLSSTFTDSIFILSKLRQNIVDFQGIITDYHYKMLFLQQKTAADIDGNFTIEVEPKDTITIKFIGMQDRIIKLSEMNFEKLNVITLTESGGLTGEIVVIKKRHNHKRK